MQPAPWIQALVTENDSVETTGSLIDYPHAGLPTILWQKDEVGKYQLKPEVGEDIRDKVVACLNECLNSPETWMVRLLMGSSIATQFYGSTTDIDIKVVIDEDAFKEANPGARGKSGWDLENWALEQLKGHDSALKIDQHPFELFIVPAKEADDPTFLKRFDVLYDITNGVWIKEPKLVDPLTYSRKEMVGPGLKIALKQAEDWDLTLGRIRRSLHELRLIEDYLALEPDEEKKDLNAYRKRLFAEIVKAVRKLQTEKQSVKDERGKEYKKETDREFINSMPMVIALKSLASWGYFSQIKGLTRYLDAHKTLVLEDVQPLMDLFDGKVVVS
jgi:hypothetical protein